MNDAIRSIVLHIDGPERAPAQLAFARQLAIQHGAALTVLYAAVPAIVATPPTPESGAMVASVLAELDDDLLAKTRLAFDACAALGQADIRFANAVGMDAQTRFVRQALFADLLVLGQRAPDAPVAGRTPADFVESVLLASGRPAIVTPYVQASGAVAFETVMIAWKETPQAARAVTAALPILRAARQVHVVGWGGEPSEVEGRSLDLAGYLQLHGVTAQMHEEGAEPAEVGELILSRAFDLQADLLVMGCYGHSRAREWVLGGASRTLLQSMTLPVLMSH